MQVADLEQRASRPRACASMAVLDPSPPVQREVLAQAVGEAVADEAEADPDEDDHEARQGRDPPGREDAVLALGDHRAPLGRRRADAEAEIGEGREHQDVEHDVRHREDEARAQQVGEGVAEDDPRGRVAEGLRGEDELLLALDEHLAAREPGVERPAHREHADVGAGQPGPGDGHDGEDQDDEREGDDVSTMRIDDRVEPAAAIAGERADQGAEHERDESGDDGRRSGRSARRRRPG